MKRTLIIMRHAKSSWDNDALSDHERPLNARGRRNAPHIGRCLAQRGYVPDSAIVSDATRTTETWHEMWAAMPDVEPRFSRNLYLGDLSDIAKEVQAVPPDHETVLVLGHNPGFSVAAGWLSGEHVELKTAHAAVLQSRLECWADGFVSNAWTLVELVTPDTECAVPPST